MEYGRGGGVPGPMRWGPRKVRVERIALERVEKDYRLTRASEKKIKPLERDMERLRQSQCISWSEPLESN